MRVNILIALDNDFTTKNDPRAAVCLIEKIIHRQNIEVRYYDGSIGALYDHDEVKRSLWRPDELVEWADFFVIACLSAGSLSKMLQGGTDNFLLEVLRSWDVSKKILLIPGMTYAMWENPMTRKQINKIRRKWNWIRVLEPVLWHGSDDSLNAGQDWAGMDDLVQEVQNQADLISIGHDVEPIPGRLLHSPVSPHPSQVQLPSEIWSLIMEHVGDWEVARSLGIYTNLTMPTEWRAHAPKATPTSLVDVQPIGDLEWTMLVGTYEQVLSWFRLHATPKWLSSLCVKLIIKFSRTNLLSYIESNHKDLFWSTFGHTLLPTKASAVFGQIAILDWWNTSPSFLTKEYNAEALDSASKAGFIHVLDWWRNSRLPLRYTVNALEQASSRGNLEVLEWWRRASLPQISETQTDHDEACVNDHPNGCLAIRASNTPNTNPPPSLPLAVGKSIIYAAQNGQAATLQWWIKSGIPFGHEASVARIASANGHIDVLQLWKECKGAKMQYDNQVLVGPTKNGHVDVLEWWKQSKYTVEYKTCDIEEALEDSLGGSSEDSIRAWWARNGLNLGVGTSEWMKVKVL